MATTGTLKVHILEAKLTRDTETFGKMDPFVIIETRMQRIRTATKDNAGKHPVWSNEVANIDVKYVGDDMVLSVFDEDVTTSDIVGSATIKLSALCLPGGMDDWFEIQYRGKKAGMVHLRGEWHPSGQPLATKPAKATGPPQLVYTTGRVATI